MNKARSVIRSALSTAAAVLLPQAMSISLNVDRALAFEIERDLSCPTTRLLG